MCQGAEGSFSEFGYVSIGPQSLVFLECKPTLAPGAPGKPGGPEGPTAP